MLGDRASRGYAPFVALCVAHAAIITLAAIGGGLIGPMLAPNARALLLATALLATGCSMMLRSRRPDPIAPTSAPSAVAACLDAATLAISDRTSLLTFALAARSPTPGLAACGALVASLVLALAAHSLGERRWRARTPFGLTIGGGTAFVILGLWSAASGFGVI